MKWKIIFCDGGKAKFEGESSVPGAKEERQNIQYRIFNNQFSTNETWNLKSGTWNSKKKRRIAR